MPGGCQEMAWFAISIDRGGFFEKSALIFLGDQMFQFVDVYNDFPKGHAMWLAIVAAVLQVFSLDYTPPGSTIAGDILLLAIVFASCSQISRPSVEFG